MNTILELQRFLRQANHLKQYNLQPDDKVHLLYVSPKLNATGYYRAIAPALELNKTKTHKALITSIDQNDFAKRFDNQLHHLDELLIKWADYIVFPSTMGNLRYLIKAIQIINPHVQLIMDIDKDYFDLKNDSKLTASYLEQFQSNLLEMDSVTVASERLYHSLKKQMSAQKTKPMIWYLPTLISSFAYENIDKLTEKETDTIRIGLIKTNEDALIDIKELLLKINDSNKAIKWVYFGNTKWSKTTPEWLNDFNIEFHNSVHFKDYFKTLDALKLDLVLIPDTDESLYERLNLELSAFKIPLLYLGDYNPELSIENKENDPGMSFENKFAMVVELIKNKPLRLEVGRNNLKKTWKLKGYNQKNRVVFFNIFI